MKLSKRGLFWLLGLVSFAILLLFSQPLGAQAATNYHAKDYTTAASVINGPDFKHADTIQIQYQMSFGDTAFKAGTQSLLICQLIWNHGPLGLLLM
ncbi:putative peptidoglycan bound protein [Lactiplantibacillus plantarum]|nr:putative peptidoglycan bound protein [Lactiplantibacillus plantarum]MCG0575798.1 putative peptidoglycan bound protein (LPXTG motif)-like protein [Lactiplantibacillus plantarum]